MRYADSTASRGPAMSAIRLGVVDTLEVMADEDANARSRTQMFPNAWFSNAHFSNAHFSNAHFSKAMKRKRTA
ncbi:MAG: pentapeptide repeat-containing protein [Pseudomonadales bacterium]